MDKRKFERVPLHRSVTLVDETGTLSFGEARDISIGGMFIEGVTAPFGSPVTVEIEGLEDVLPAVVRWVRDDGVGVQFGLLGVRETHAITEIVAHLAPSQTREMVPARRVS